MRNKRFAIVGGGIAGLTLAIALQRKDINAIVYESAPTLKPLGAGLILAANAVKAFQEIGISDEILEAGKILKVLRIQNSDGNTLSETDSEKISSKLGVVNNFSIHRADLHTLLIKLLKPDTLQLNKSCVDFIQEQDGVTVKFQDNTTAQADYMIACDGIHSTIRKKLLPESSIRFAGYTCWRAVINDVPADVNMDETSETWGPGRRFGIAPLSHNRLYWFACINAQHDDARMKSYKIPDLLAQFSNFPFPIANILNRTSNDQLIWNDIIDIKPLRKFAFGNIVLLGDAAHATTPNMGQGACMAIEDAAILSNSLEHYASPEEAFVQFEKKRITRTTAIVNYSWIIGKIAQLENPLLISLRNTAIKLTPSRVTEKQMRSLTEISFK